MAEALLLGEILCQSGVVTRGGLRQALREQGETERPLGEILLERGQIDARALERALAAQRAQLEQTDPRTGRARRDSLFGGIALQGGWLRAEELHRALRDVADGHGPGRKLGDVLRDSGALDEDEVRDILREQDRRAIRKVLTCRTCGTAYDGTKAVAGGKCRCRGCGRVFEVPAALFLGASVRRPRPAGGAVPTQRHLGPYEITGEVARGGMGIVYRAVHASLAREVALKVLTAGPGTSADMVQRFRAESRAAARLRHPAIVPIYDVGVQGDRHYFAMEFVAGETFDAWCRRERPSIRAIAGVLADVADGLTHAHARGIVHRDVKPGNVLLDVAGRPHITDFGLAVDVQADQRMTASGVALGTPSYMSPEQARGETGAVDGRSDVFSLGIVLYEALTGKNPFEGATVMDTLLRVTQEEARSPREHRPDLPVDYEAVCLRALEKEPDARYPGMAAMGADLRRLARGEPVGARPPGLLQRGLRRLRRHPGVALALAGTMLLGAGLSVGMLYASVLVGR